METTELTRPTADAESYEAHKALRTAPKAAPAPVSSAAEVTSPQSSEAAGTPAPAPAAPEAAQPQDKGKKHERNTDAEGRIRELNTRASAAEKERDELRKQLEEARKSSAAAPSPQPVPQAPPRIVQEPVPPPAAAADDKEPDDTDPKYADKPYRDFLRDHARWTARQEWAARESAQREHAEAQTIQQKVAEARAKLPDFDTVLPNANWNDPGLRKFMKDWPNAPEMLHYAMTHPEAQQALRSAPTEAQAIYQWGLISQTVAGASAAPSVSSPHIPETPPQPRLVSRVPPPPRLLGGSDAPPPKSTADARTFDEHKALRRAGTR